MIIHGSDLLQDILGAKDIIICFINRLVPAQDGLFALILWYVSKDLY